MPSLETMLPWWPRELDPTLSSSSSGHNSPIPPPPPGCPPTGVFHSSTMLPGKLSVIVDTGAWTNLCGERLAKQLATRAGQHGKKVYDREMKRPLTVAGVGSGQQKCHWEVVAPVAVPTKDGPTGEGTFTSPIVQGAGENLPALLGLRSMEQQRAIVDTGGQALILPGPGEVEIVLPPGSVVVPLEKAPSGHLVMVLDDYENVGHRRGGTPPRTMQFLAHPEDTARGEGKHPTRYSTRGLAESSRVREDPDEDRVPDDIAYDDEMIDQWLASRRARRAPNGQIHM